MSNMRALRSLVHSSVAEDSVSGVGVRVSACDLVRAALFRLGRELYPAMLPAGRPAKKWPGAVFAIFRTHLRPERDPGRER
jgi:hypothetical protein